MPKTQRIRDPVHGLIVFHEGDDTDELAWRLINTREFQRLRRIRQLGFSELVFPGATHTRFAHSLGAYQTARKLTQIVRARAGGNLERQHIACIAALLHDIGHGPFSHAFEEAARNTGKARRHEEWSAEIISGDTEIQEVLGPDLAREIAEMLRADEPKDVYATVVSSQFDADRLDYVQRDRLMTGVKFAHVDQDWLMDCLEVGTVTMGSPDDPVVEYCLYLNPKGMRVAEEYLEARFRLYLMMYMHKTTRGAERLLARLLNRLTVLAQDPTPNLRPLIQRSWLAKWLREESPHLHDYLALDDTIVWAEIARFREAPDTILGDLAGRLYERRLYKCFDLGERLDPATGDSQRLRFMRRLRETFPGVEEGLRPYMVDDAEVTIYKWYEFESPSALEKVLVKRHSQDSEPVDIGNWSNVIRALRAQERLYRVYVPDQEDRSTLEEIWREVSS